MLDEETGRTEDSGLCTDYKKDFPQTSYSSGVLDYKPFLFFIPICLSGS